jgi:hypothetical protein
MLMLVGAALHHVNARAMRFRMGVLKRRDGVVCRSASDGWMDGWFGSEVECGNVGTSSVYIP